MKNIYLTFLFSALLVLSMGSCKDSPPVVNPDDTTTTPKDPCKGYSSTPPIIMIHEQIEDTTYLLRDTVYGGSSTIVFSASRTYDSYQWEVGDDDRIWRDSSFTLRFRDYSGPIQVSLITFRAQDTVCINKDDGRDTVIKVFNVINPNPNIDVPPITGIYRGVSTENPLDTFEVKMGFLGIGIHPLAMSIQNLPKGCIDPPNPRISGPLLRIGYGRRGFHIYKTDNRTGTDCRSMYGKGWLNEDGSTITIRYSAHAKDDATKRIDATFIGVRQ